MQIISNAHGARPSNNQQPSSLVTNGVGPRSGGDVDPSGAEAKRKEGVQPPGDFVLQDELTFSQGLQAQGNAYWCTTQEQVEAMTLGDAAKELCRSTALLLRLANASQGDDAVVVRRWLHVTGPATGIAAIVSGTAEGWSK